MKEITPLKRCIQLLARQGVTNTNEIARFVNVTPQAVNRAKREMERTYKFAFEPISSENEPTSSKMNPEVPLACTHARANSNPFGVSSTEDNNNKNKQKKSRSPFPDYVEDAYKRIAKVYPKSLGGNPIKQKLHALLADNRDLVETIVSAIEERRGFRLAPDGSPAKTPHFSTWLNQQRWEDEPLQKPQKTKKKRQLMPDLQNKILNGEMDQAEAERINEERWSAHERGGLQSQAQMGSNGNNMPGLFPH